MKTKKKHLKRLSNFANHQLTTLCPSNFQGNKFKASFLQFEGYTDLLLTVESLINVCMLASHIDTSTSSEDHGLDIRKTLELASKLLPFDEGEFLDEAYRLLVKKP